MIKHERKGWHIYTYIIDRTNEKQNRRRKKCEYHNMVKISRVYRHSIICIHTCRQILFETYMHTHTHSLLRCRSDQECILNITHTLWYVPTVYVVHWIKTQWIQTKNHINYTNLKYISQYLSLLVVHSRSSFQVYIYIIYAHLSASLYNIGWTTVFMDGWMHIKRAQNIPKRKKRE